MSSEPIDTVVKMLESLHNSAQKEVAEHLRNYIAEIQDDIRIASYMVYHVLRNSNGVLF